MNVHMPRCAASACCCASSNCSATMGFFSGMAIVFAKKQTESLRYCSRGQRPRITHDKIICPERAIQACAEFFGLPFQGETTFFNPEPRALPSATIAQTFSLFFRKDNCHA